jgi:hypothetical protein
MAKQAIIEISNTLVKHFDNKYLFINKNSAIVFESRSDKFRRHFKQQFLTHNNIKHFLDLKRMDVEALIHFCAGAIGGTAGWVCNFHLKKHIFGSHILLKNLVINNSK